MLQTFQHNAAFLKSDSEEYQQFRRFCFHGNISMRAVYFLISTIVILTVTTERLKSFPVTCYYLLKEARRNHTMDLVNDCYSLWSIYTNNCASEARRNHTMYLIKDCCSLCSIFTNKTVSLKSTVFHWLRLSSLFGKNVALFRFQWSPLSSFSDALNFSVVRTFTPRGVIEDMCKGAYLWYAISFYYGKLIVPGSDFKPAGGIKPAEGI